MVPNAHDRGLAVIFFRGFGAASLFLLAFAAVFVYTTGQFTHAGGRQATAVVQGPFR